MTQVETLGSVYELKGFLAAHRGVYIEVALLRDDDKKDIYVCRVNREADNVVVRSQ